MRAMIILGAALLCLALAQSGHAMQTYYRYKGGVEQGAAGIPEAPVDGSTYGRSNGAWSPIPGGGDLVSTNNLSDVPNKPLARTNLGLGSVDNTADADKPVSTPQQTALDGKAGTASPTIATPTLTGKITYVGVAVDDDDCTGDQGKMWFDSVDVQFEFCNANSGTPIAISTGSGDMLLGTTQTVTASKTFADDVPLIFGSDSDFQADFDSTAGELQINGNTASDLTIRFINSGAGNTEVIADYFGTSIPNGYRFQQVVNSAGYVGPTALLAVGAYNYNQSTGQMHFWDGTDWNKVLLDNESTQTVTGKTIDNDVNTLNNMPVDFCVAISDESTALTTGTAKRTFRSPWAFTLTGVRASVGTSPTGANLTIDINESGVSVLSTVLSIDATEKTSVTATTAAVISDSSIADDAEMAIDIDQVGSTVAGSGAKVCFYGKRNF